MQCTQGRNRKPAHTQSVCICVLRELCEQIVLLCGKRRKARECIAHRRIIGARKLRQEFVTDAVAPRVHRIIRRIVARHQPPLHRIRLDLRTHDSEEGAQIQSVPFPHCRESCRSRAAQDAHEHRLREIIRMVREHDGIAFPFITHTVEKVIATDARRRLERAFMRTRIGRHIARLEDERNPAHRTERLHKTRIRQRICAAYPVLIVRADELRAARRMQDIQRVQQGKRIRPAGTSDEKLAHRIEKIMCAQNAFHNFLHNQLHEKGHSGRSALFLFL